MIKHYKTNVFQYFGPARMQECKQECKNARMHSCTLASLLAPLCVNVPAAILVLHPLAGSWSGNLHKGAIKQNRMHMNCQRSRQCYQYVKVQLSSRLCVHRLVFLCSRRCVSFVRYLICVRFLHDGGLTEYGQLIKRLETSGRTDHIRSYVYKFT